jgi:hypothetical protein
VAHELPIEDDGDIFGSSQYNKACAVYAHFQVRLAKLQFEERSGALVRADEVRTSVFNLYRGYRDRLLNLPDRLSAMLAAETDAVSIHQVLAD